ncbi:L-threonylcarbamoyladenylate synthase [Pseudocnuella soli]|uniref:L-threonylcarbamoyladenylate synthase n=1 Tax=Pseudocnuella soli TaxID=2502779 RepID=UPI0010446C18|nr:L-threonylcarbamoyladenylate synthase [Pseudocnuella soli]
MEAFEHDIQQCLEVLHNGGLILYPTDTIWGIGCDATHEAAVQKVYALKNRAESKSLIVLLADERDVLRYVAAPDLAVFDYVATQERPTTIIFDGALGLASNMVADDGSVGIRLVQDTFCRHLIKRFRKPLVSTSANISGDPSPAHFGQITDAIKTGVDYVVQWRQEETTAAQPSQIIRWVDGAVQRLR